MELDRAQLEEHFDVLALEAGSCYSYCNEYGRVEQSGFTPDDSSSFGWCICFSVPNP